MTIISMPQTTVNLTSAQLTVDNLPQKILFVGQMSSAGTATPGVLVQNLQTNLAAIPGLFGVNSHIANMLKGFTDINILSQIDVIPLADPSGGTQAATIIGFSGTSTAAGSYTLVVGSSHYHTITVNLASGLTAAQAATAFAAAFNAADDSVMMVASVDGIVTTQVDLTCVHKGLIGNSIGFSFSGSVAGLTPSVTFQDTAGTGTPTITGIFTQVADIRYQTVVWPYSYYTSAPLDVLQAFLDPRFNTTNALLDGVGIVTWTIDYADLITQANALNDQSICLIGNAGTNQVGSTKYFQTPAIFEYQDVISAEFAAIRSLRLTPGASIAQYVNAASSLDSFGGPAIASLPYFNTPMYNLPLTPNNEGFTDAQIAGLLTAGASVIGNNPSNTLSILGQFVTTYKTTPASVPDVTFKYLEYVDTESNVREYFYNNLNAAYSQCRLTEGALIPGRKMANANSIAAFCVGLYSDLADEDFVLTQAGETALTYFKDNLIVTINLANGSANISMVVPIITQLRTILANIQISFSTNG